MFLLNVYKWSEKDSPLEGEKNHQTHVTKQTTEILLLGMKTLCQGSELWEEFQKEFT